MKAVSVLMKQLTTARRKFHERGRDESFDKKLEKLRFNLNINILECVWSMVRWYWCYFATRFEKDASWMFSRKEFCRMFYTSSVRIWWKVVILHLKYLTKLHFDIDNFKAYSCLMTSNIYELNKSQIIHAFTVNGTSNMNRLLIKKER